MATPIPAVITEVYAVPTTTLAKIYGPVPVGEEHSLNVRLVSLSTAVADIADVKTQRAGVVTGVRCLNQNVDPATGIDVDGVLTLNAGAEIWARTGGGNIGVSITGTKRFP